MHDNLGDFPLFGGSISKLKNDNDFSEALSFEDVRAGFGVDKKLLEAFIKSCKMENENPNDVISTLMELYNNKVSR